MIVLVSSLQGQLPCAKWNKSFKLPFLPVLFWIVHIRNSRLGCTCKILRSMLCVHTFALCSPAMYVSLPSFQQKYLQLLMLHGLNTCHELFTNFVSSHFETIMKQNSSIAQFGCVVFGFWWKMYTDCWGNCWQKYSFWARELFDHFGLRNFLFTLKSVVAARVYRSMQFLATVQNTVISPWNLHCTGQSEHDQHYHVLALCG